MSRLHIFGLVVTGAAVGTLLVIGAVFGYAMFVMSGVSE